jgi:hypothetical protein
VGESLPPASAPTPTSTASAAEAQPVAPSGTGDREDVANAVARATTQIDRLRRIERSPIHENRETLDAALDDLESARRNVLQDLREVELDPGGSVIRGQLRRHLGHLQSALDASYEAWPPTGQAVPHAASR